MSDPQTHHRRSVRLENFDYASAGAYFITICINERRSLFGEVVDGQMVCNGAGQLIEREWQNLGQRFPDVVLDQFIVMPNHVHGVLGLTRPDMLDPRLGEPRVRPLHDSPPTGTLPGTIGRILQAFKSLTTNVYIAGVKTLEWERFKGRLWQPNYYDHIIRHDRALHAIRDYIFTNPRRWSEDRENPLGDGSDDLDRFVRSVNLLNVEEGEHKVRPYE